MSIQKNVLILISALVFPALLHAQTLPVQIISIVDGDTIKVQDKNGAKYTVSMSGIDAPEMSQAYGKESKDALCKLICDKDVVLSYNKLNTKGHVLSTVYLNGIDINRIMLNKGMVWQKISDKGALSRYNFHNYAQAENSARIQNLGLWQDGMVIAPWRWRQINQVAAWE